MNNHIRRYCTWSPLLPCLSWHTQSGTWSSSGKRVWFTESHIYLFLFVYLLIYSFVQRKVVLYKVTSKSHFIHLTCWLALTHIVLIRDCSSPSTASVSYRLPGVISFKFRSVPPLLSITNHPWTHVASLNL